MKFLFSKDYLFLHFPLILNTEFKIQDAIIVSMINLLFVLVISFFSNIYIYNYQIIIFTNGRIRKVQIS